jgi:beta-lactamase regulating signal transducer with metallopeptidase domain
MSELSRLGGALVSAWGPISLFTLALLAGAALLDLACRRRVRASWRLMFYLPVLARALLPAGWSTPLGALRAHGAQLSPGAAGGHFQFVGEGTAAAVPSWKALVALLWLAGAAALILAWAIAQWRLSRALATAKPARSDWARLAPEHTVLEHGTLGPMVVGFWRPRILLPSALPPDPAGILRHERAHLDRHDPLLVALLQLAQALLWPILPVVLAVWRMRQLMELACDERALAGSDDSERQRYGAALLAVAELRTVRLRPRPAFELHFGASLRARMRALRARHRWPAPLQAILTVGAAGLLLACAGTRPPPAATTVYTGRHIDLDFKEANLLNILRLLGDVGHVKIWVDDSIAINPPKVTLLYRDVPWDQVLDEIGKKYAGQIRHEGNTYYLSRYSTTVTHTYTGKNIDIDVQDADIHQVMEVLGNAGGVRIVVDDEVQAKVSIHLTGTPWDEALDNILWTKGLIAHREGDVIRVVRIGPP